MARPTKNLGPVALKVSNSTKVKVFHMAIGLDLVGSRTSFAADHNNELECTAIGIKMFSKKSGRTIVIPYANIKGFELQPE